MTEQSPNSVPRRHRRGLTRSAAACQRCRRRKQKCDGRTPTCGACAAVGAHCVLSDRLMIQPMNSNCDCDLLRGQLETAGHRYNALLEEYERLKVERLEVFQASGIEPGLQGSTPAPLPDPVADNPQQDKIPVTSSHQEDVQINPDIRYCGRILRPTFSHRPNAKDINGSTLSSAWELWGDDPVHLDESSQTTAITTEFDCDAYGSLVNIFFDRRWPYLPVLHKPSFVNEHLTPFLVDSNASSTSSFLVNIVCAIAATEKSWIQQGNGSIHRQFFNEAKKVLHVIMGIADFECVQCLLLLCMYGHNEPQSVNMWYTTGLALHLAIGIDLHRKESLSGQNLLVTEMSKRIFWSAYVMNCSMAINMGRPLGIQESDITMPLPLQLTDDELSYSAEFPDLSRTTIPQVTDTSTFIHIIKLRKINAGVYRSFHSIGCTLSEPTELDIIRNCYYSELNQWLITAPRYINTLSTFQSMEWFQIAFHHAVLSLYRPSRAAPMPSSDDLRVCTESAIGLISSYSGLYARNRIKYTFVAIHSLFMAAVSMLYALRASPPLRQELTRPVVQTNIFTFLTLFRGISNGRAVGEKCSNIVERLGNSILTLFDDVEAPGDEVDTEFQSWFGLQTHTFATPARNEVLGEDAQGISPHFPDIRVDLPWADLFVEGFDMGSTDVWSFLS
ncbi:hypothetical protein ASPWEDRAFT_46965 [Aspergillus wentii DTO 134E9]|uniref:Zn(2)-C6 fungal-type domain-containing protein n=1 Tax=Aspergillus wentii DTO 134E9 TaxID=1073089 RepID=A0A1L9RYJ3_ASPWE|nr:uncharacterized protein ASPWEDRAFT_46965 [Aspergillus wentii DTO 134E9]KAI9932432.1 hypothetical protein MW887_008673 [Aspergillus wentii]OJJ39999.1 hypothetical protein ASPWEDRAFT_46965 [Aspergillus wentii DTO 134E9]